MSKSLADIFPLWPKPGLTYPIILQAGPTEILLIQFHFIPLLNFSPGFLTISRANQHGFQISSKGLRF